MWGKWVDLCRWVDDRGQFCSLCVWLNRTYWKALGRNPTFAWNAQPK